MRKYNVTGYDREGIFEAQGFGHSKESALKWIEEHKTLETSFVIGYIDFPDDSEERMFGPNCGKLSAEEEEMYLRERSSDKDQLKGLI